MYKLFEEYLLNDLPKKGEYVIFFIGKYQYFLVEFLSGGSVVKNLPKILFSYGDHELLKNSVFFDVNQIKGDFPKLNTINYNLDRKVYFVDNIVCAPKWRGFDEKEAIKNIDIFNSSKNFNL